MSDFDMKRLYITGLKKICKLLLLLFCLINYDKSKRESGQARKLGKLKAGKWATGWYRFIDIS